MTVFVSAECFVRVQRSRRSECHGEVVVTVGTTARRGIDGLASVLRIVGMLSSWSSCCTSCSHCWTRTRPTRSPRLINQLADTFNLGLSNLFLPPDPKLRIVLNYGTAALVWFAITSVVVRIVRRIP